MLAALRSRLTSAHVIAVVALVFALGGFAVARIPSRDGTITACYEKKKGTLRVIDEKKKCSRKSERKLTWNKQGRAGSDGLAGSPGRPGDPGLAGTARAYGLVARDGTLDPNIRKNATVTRVASGAYCITLDASVDASKTRAVATLDHTTADTNAIVNVASSFPGCSGNSTVVETANLTTVTGTGAGTASDQGFFFAVP
jgi:hypothetical protein